MWSSLVALGVPSLSGLIYLDLPDDVRYSRVAHRDGISENDVRALDSHPVEQETPALRTISHLIIDGGQSPTAVMDLALNWLFRYRHP